MIGTVLGLPGLKTARTLKTIGSYTKNDNTPRDPIVSGVGYMGNTLHDTI